MKALTTSLDLVVRLISATLLLCVSAFCVFGFLASFEPGNGALFKIGYGALGSGCLVGAIHLLVQQRSNAMTSRVGTSKIVAGTGLFFLAVFVLFLFVLYR
jgi:hypothetical protein